MTPFQFPTAARLLLAAGITAWPVRAFETVGAIENLSSRNFRVRFEEKGIRFVMTDPATGRLSGFAHPFTLLPGYRYTVQATKASLQSGHGFTVTCYAGPGETLEGELSLGVDAATAKPRMTLDAWRHELTGGAGQKPCGITCAIEGKVLTIREGGASGAGKEETKSQHAPRSTAGETKGAEGAGTAPAMAARKAAEQKEAEQRAALLDRQCAQVRQAIEAWRKQDPTAPIHMVLGAWGWQTDRFGPDHWIFLDDLKHDHWKPVSTPHFQANFNNLEEFRKVAEAVEGQLDSVQFDQAVWKFAKWRKEHLDLVRTMLKPEGVFHFPLYQCFHAYYNLAPRELAAQPSVEELAALYAPDAPADQIPRDFHAPGNIHGLDPKLRSSAEKHYFYTTFKATVRDLLLGSFGQVEEAAFLPDYLRMHLSRPTGPQAFLLCAGEPKKQ